MKDEYKWWFDDVKEIIKLVKESNNFKSLEAVKETNFEKNKEQFIKIFNEYNFPEHITDKIKEFALNVAEGAMEEFFAAGFSLGVDLAIVHLRMKADAMREALDKF